MNAIVTDDHERIMSADKVIFPGVGEASSAMRYLKDHSLDTIIKNLRQPVVGICLGMQLMCKYSEENDTECLGVFDASVKKFQVEDLKLKVPQIGWNKLSKILGYIVPNILLSIVFFVFLLPVSLISKLFHKDTLMLSRKYKTYYIEVNKEMDKASFEKTW